MRLNLSPPPPLQNVTHAALTLCAEPSALVLISFTTSLAGIRCGEATQTFDLPAGDAAQTLKQFSTQAGREIVFAPAAVSSVKTNEVKGDLEPKAALDALSRRHAAWLRRRTRKPEPLRSRRKTSPNAPRVVPPEATTPKDQSKVEEGKLVLDKVEVTGSRIHTTFGEATPNPVLTYSATDLGNMGVQSVYDLARYIPQLSMESGPDPETQGNVGNQFRGTATAFGDLRGVGSTFSLVLVNGRRLPRTQQYKGSDSQDLDGIPFAAIERIEILPAGASAIYGSSAVTGVINIILRKDYNAATLTLSYRNTWDTDTGKRTASLTFGRSQGKFSYSRGHSSIPTPTRSRRATAGGTPRSICGHMAALTSAARFRVAPGRCGPPTARCYPGSPATAPRFPPTPTAAPSRSRILRMPARSPTRRTRCNTPTTPRSVRAAPVSGWNMNGGLGPRCLPAASGRKQSRTAPAITPSLSMAPPPYRAASRSP